MPKPEAGLRVSISVGWFWLPLANQAAKLNGSKGGEHDQKQTD